MSYVERDIPDGVKDTMLPAVLRGAYSVGQVLVLGGWQLNGASAPTVLRDGSKVSSAQKKFSVSRNSAGLYTVTFTSGYPLPALPFIDPKLEQAAAPSAPCKIHYVKNSWSTTTRSFQVQIQTVGTTPAASDADAGDRVTFWMYGSLMSAGTDPA